MNIIWDLKAINKSDYLRFLSCVCSVSDKGININQENIYKLYKCYTSKRAVIKFDEYFKSGSLVF